MIQKEVQEIINRIALKYNKPVYVIEEIFMSQWKFLKEKICKEDINLTTFKTVKFAKWGKYYLSERKLKRIRKYNPTGKKKYGRKTDGESNNQTDTGITG